MKRFERVSQAIEHPIEPEDLAEFYPHFYTWPDSEQEAFNDLLTKAAQADPIDPEACKKMLEIAHRNGTPETLKVIRILKILTP